MSKPSDGKETVKCMDCETEYDLFYDLTKTTEVLSDGEEVEGYDIDQERDPIRCVLCRQNPRYAENEAIICEECMENGKVFCWTGRYQDTIVCKECVNGETEFEEE